MEDVASPSSTRAERRLRAVVRLVLYPLALALIALAWREGHARMNNPGGPPQVRWRGMTDQGQKIGAITAGGFLISLDTHLVEPCANGSPWTLHWSPTEPNFTQTGDDVVGHMGPKPITSYTGEPVLIETRVRARIGTHPHGTLLGTAIRSPGPSSVGCTSGPVTFTLQRNS